MAFYDPAWPVNLASLNKLLPSFLSWYSLHCIEQCMYVMRADSRANVTASCGPFFPPLDAVFKLTTEISECLSCAVAMMFMLMMHSSLALLNVLTHLESMATHSPINRRCDICSSLEHKPNSPLSTCRTHHELRCRTCIDQKKHTAPLPPLSASSTCEVCIIESILAEKEINGSN